MIKVLNVAGARPNFMKVAPLIRAFERQGIEQRLIHTGQHYDDAMSKVFFDDLGIPAPNENLEVGPGDRLGQIERIMQRFAPVLRAERPDAVVVVGDVNSTVACARVAKAQSTPVVHVEAGLRSFDESMPEELNRVETDRLSDLLFVTEESGLVNIAREGLPGKAFLVGNVMIDTLALQLPKAKALGVAGRFDLVAGEFIVVTFHRPSNVDDPERLRGLVAFVEWAAARLPLIWPVHPRTRGSLEKTGLLERMQRNSRIVLTAPLGYLEFVSLVADSRAVVTDSGGIQEETTFLQIPCVTMRDNTERPATVEVGSNVLAGSRTESVQSALADALAGARRRGRVPPLWDGRAADRISAILERELRRM
jgi:UDP-N-acetylglucosamine 2-epimerase (non-hydrolysing)